MIAKDTLSNTVCPRKRSFYFSTLLIKSTGLITKKHSHTHTGEARSVAAVSHFFLFVHGSNYGANTAGLGVIFPFVVFSLHV